jgi:hypothetical protein
MLKMYRTHLFGVVPVIQQFHKILHIVFLIYCPSCLGSWRRQNEDVITRGGVVIRPAFKNAKQQFNPQQVESSRKIASVRIYVEQAIKRVKAYRALDNKRTPIKLFQSELWRWDDDSILTTQPLVSLIYSAFECKIQWLWY